MTDAPGSLPLATLCGACDHTRMWHNTGGCVAHSCGCGLFTAPTAGQRPAPMDPVHILGVEATPDAARQARRKHLADLILRMRRGELHSQGRDILAAVIKDELADGDQARRGEAEAVRAREAAETEVKRLSAKLTAAQAENDGLAECMRNTDRLTTAKATELHTRAEFAQELLIAAVKRADLAERVKRSAAKDAAAALARAARAERDLADMHAAESADAAAGSYAARAERAEISARAHKTAATEALERAERAEATLTAVRALLPDNPRDDKWTDHVTATAVRGALGDPQPATVPEADDTSPASPVYNLVSYIIERQWADAERTTDEIHADVEPLLAAIRAESVTADPCAHGCRDAADEHTRLSQELDTEPACGCGNHDCEICHPVQHDMTAPEREQPAEPLLRGTAPQVHVHLDNRGAMYHPWPQEWRAQPAEPWADAAAELADAYRAYQTRRRAELAAAMRALAAAFRSGDRP